MVFDPFIDAFARRASRGIDAVRFLREEGPDGSGRRLSEVLAFDDTTLELRHDFIQWLFPLAEASGAVPNSPVLTPADISAIRESPEAQANLRAARDRMLCFYVTTDRWLRNRDHNHLRITRIIKSLRLLAGDDIADAFRVTLLARVAAAKAQINSITLNFWAQA